MATAAQINAITALYVGYFNRAPDPAGLQFWIDQIDGGREFNTIAADFAASPEATGLYPYLTTPDVSTPSAFITSIYANLFGRTPDAEGLAFWSGVLAEGTVDVADFIEAIIIGAVDDADAGTFDRSVLDNKVEVGLDFALSAANVSGFAFDDVARSAAIDAVDGVTEDAATVDAALAATDAFLSGVENLGSTLTLTTSIDDLQGTTANDTFVGIINTADDDTFTIADTIDGGAGVDTLRLTSSDDTDEIDLSIADIVNVENVELRIANEDFDTLDLNDADGAFSQVMIDFRGVDQDSDLEISNVNANTAITLMDAVWNGFDLEIDLEGEAETGSLTLSNIDGADNLEIDFVDDGDDDTYTLNFDGVTSDSDGFDIFITGLENMTVNVTAESNIDDFEVYSDINGSQTVTFNLDADLTIDSSLDLTDDDEEALFTITGAGNLTIEDLGDSSGQPDLTVDASAATGNIDLGTVETQVTGLEVTLGSGDDRIALDSGFDLDVIRSLDGGAGIDIIGLDADEVAGISGVDISGFETLEISGSSSADVTIDADDNDFDNVILSANVGNVLTIEDLSGGITIQEDQGGTVIATPEGVSDDLVVTFDLPDDTVTVNVLDVSGYASVDFVTISEDGDETDVVLTTLDVADVGSLSFSGEGDVDIDGATAGDVTTVDLSEMTGVFDNTGAAYADDADTIIGNLGGGSYIEQATTGDTNTVSFTGELDNAIDFDGFEGGVGGDVLDFSSFGIGSFADLEFTDSGFDVEITADEFDGTLTLVGVNQADLDGTANFIFA